MSFYVDKHLFSNTLYVDPTNKATVEDIKKVVNKENEDAGITCYGKYNIIGFFKERMGLAFKQTISEGKESKVIYVDAKSFAEWKYAEISSRKEKDNLTLIFENISQNRKKNASTENVWETRENVQLNTGKYTRDLNINKLLTKVKERIKENKTNKDEENNLFKKLNEEANQILKEKG